LITSVTLSGGNLVVSGTNGTATQPYYVISANDLTVPLSNWTRLATNLFANDGSFSFTNSVNQSVPQMFFLLQLP